MSFPRFAYLDWIRAHRDAAPYSFLLSGMPPPPPELLSFTPGDADLRGEFESSLLRALSQTFSVPEEAIVPAAGTTGAVFVTLAALISPGDLVAVETPTFELLHATPSALGARLIRLPRLFEEGFGVREEDLERVLAARPKVLVLANPHNPSGKLLDREALAALIQRARQVGTEVLVDEVYLPFAAGYESAYHLGALVVGSPTKIAGLGVLRVGWVFARPEVAARIRDASNIAGHFSALPSARLLTRALSRWDEFLARGRRAQETLPILRGFVASRPELAWVEPDAGLIAFLRLRGVDDVSPFVEYARKEHGVSVIPGHFFEDSSGFRVGFGIEPELLQEGLLRLGNALDAYKRGA